MTKLNAFDDIENNDATKTVEQDNVEQDNSLLDYIDYSSDNGDDEKENDAAQNNNDDVKFDFSDAGKEALVYDDSLGDYVEQDNMDISDDIFDGGSNFSLFDEIEHSNTEAVDVPEDIMEIDQQEQLEAEIAVDAIENNEDDNLSLADSKDMPDAEQYSNNYDTAQEIERNDDNFDSEVPNTNEFDNEGMDVSVSEAIDSDFDTESVLNAEIADNLSDDGFFSAMEDYLSENTDMQIADIEPSNEGLIDTGIDNMSQDQIIDEYLPDIPPETSMIDSLDAYMLESIDAAEDTAARIAAEEEEKESVSDLTNDSSVDAVEDNIEATSSEELPNNDNATSDIPEIALETSADIVSNNPADEVSSNDISPFDNFESHVSSDEVYENKDISVDDGVNDVDIPIDTAENLTLVDTAYDFDDGGNDVDFGGYAE